MQKNEILSLEYKEIIFMILSYTFYCIQLTGSIINKDTVMRIFVTKTPFTSDGRKEVKNNIEDRTLTTFRNSTFRKTIL